LFKVNHQNSYPPNYPPGYIPHPMGYNMNSMGFIPPPPPQQNYGMFGNFVMNQLQQNIHSPYHQQQQQNMYGYNPFQQQHW
jgi:hypothetical protein